MVSTYRTYMYIANIMIKYDLHVVYNIRVISLPWHTDIIPTWQPGMQSNAHEVMMGILNSRSALVVHIPDIIRFEMLTTGQNLSVSEYY